MLKYSRAVPPLTRALSSTPALWRSAGAASDAMWDAVKAAAPDTGPQLAALDRSLAQVLEVEEPLPPAAVALGFSHGDPVDVEDFSIGRRSEDHHAADSDPLLNHDLYDTSCFMWTTHENFVRAPFNHAINRKVKMEVRLRDLGMDANTAAFVAELAGPRYNKAKRTLKLVTSQFESVAHNKRHILEQFHAMVLEAGALAKDFGHPRQAALAEAQAARLADQTA